MIQIDAGGTLSYFHQDRQNSVIAQSSSSGSVTNQYTYSPFGESASLAGSTFGYTGQRYDLETGLYFYKSRYYSPNIGRFLQPDPIGYRAGLNLFTYVDNSPLNFTDTLGLDGGVVAVPGQSATIPVSTLQQFASQTHTGIAGQPVQEYGAALMKDGTIYAGQNMSLGLISAILQATGQSKDYWTLPVAGLQSLGAAALSPVYGSLVKAYGSLINVNISVPNNTAILLIHTHQLGFGQDGKPLDTYHLSQGDLTTLNNPAGPMLPGIVVTQTGIMMYHAPGSTSLNGDAMIDRNGNYHRVIIGLDGQVSTEVKVTNPSQIDGPVEVFGPPTPAQKCAAG